VEAAFANWGGLPTESAHAALSWPQGVTLQIRQTPNLPVARKTSANGINHLELAGQDVQPLIPPKGAPERFQIGRLAEATDYSSWADIANLFVPLYRNASAIPASGPLHEEVEKIRAASANPKIRAEQALALVQDRVRYVALEMGQGGLVPAPAETTWSRRFGDCKGKTALLLGILHSLGIEAEPVLVQARAGDVIADRLPMIALFNHVLVRAHIGGKDYWLDGTRTGDTDLDSIQIPDFGWGLPLVAGAKLVHMVPAPLSVPSLERHVTMDASSGVYAPAAITIDEIYRGDSAIDLNSQYSAATAQQRDQAMSDEAKSFFDGFSVASSSIQFDKTKRELRLSMKGTAKLNWKDGWFYVPTSSVGFNADFDRTAGPLHDVPLAVTHPRYMKDEATIRLPAGFAAGQKLTAPVRETLAGVEYARTETVNGDLITVDSSERSIATEVPYKDAVAAAPRLKALNKNDVYLRVLEQYRTTDADLAALQQGTPDSAFEYYTRAVAFMDRGKTDEALRDFNDGLALDPKNGWALLKRASVYLMKNDYASAEKDVEAVQAIDPANRGLDQVRAMIAEQKDDFPACIAGFTKSLQQQPNNDFALGHRATCESTSGKYDAALADAAAALKINPSWTGMRVLRANIYMRQGKHDLVAGEAEAMTKENAKSDYAWVGAARTYAALGQRDRAMKAFDRALAIKPAAYIYINRAQIRPRSDIRGRTADLDAALKLNPNDPDALQEKAKLLSEGGDYKGALALLAQIKPDSDDPYPLYSKLQGGILLYKAGRTAEAEKLLTALRSSAKGAMDFNNLCYSQATAGIRLEAALEDCRAALKISPENGAFIDSLGMVLLKLGKLDEALAAYNQAIAKGEGAASLMGRAFVYLKKGDEAHADADADAARKLSPDIDATFAGYGLKFDQAGTVSSPQPAAAKR
ncbi:MAG: tetratricopeptide repeat protein, partial [Sphingomicrobium sp.]